MAHHSSVRGAIVVAGHPNGLTVVRALGERGIPVAVITTSRENIAHFSRYCIEHHACHNLYKNGESLVEVLEAQKRRWAGWVVYPTNDHAIAAIARHHERLARHFKLTTLPWEIAGQLLQKDSLAQVAAAVGVDRPIDYGPATLALANRADIRFPVVIKPVETHHFRIAFGCKLFAVDDAATFARRLAQVVESGLDAHVMEMIPGADDTLYNYMVYMDARGEPTSGIALHKLRKSPPFSGVGRVAETGGFDSLREPTVAMLRHVGYRGIASAEFKLDKRTGRLKFMEINARHPLPGGLARRAGIDLSHLAWQDVALSQRPVAQKNGWEGVWIHLHGEAECLLRHRRKEQWTWREYLAPYQRPKVFAVWNASDPRPFFAQWRMAAGKAIRGLFRPHAEEAPE
jgi:predicted ATP-grasp superfamily ATP-dependent carboligase